MNESSSRTSAAAKAYGFLITAGSWLQPLLLLGMRLYWGWQFFITGRGKLMNLDNTAAYFASLGIPMAEAQAALAGATECAGGLLLLAGFASRLVAIPLAFTMIVAYATAHVDSLRTIIDKPEDFIAQAPFLFLLTSLIVFAFGPGKISVDYLIQKIFIGEKKA